MPRISTARQQRYLRELSMLKAAFIVGEENKQTSREGIGRRMGRERERDPEWNLGRRQAGINDGKLTRLILSRTFVLLRRHHQREIRRLFWKMRGRRKETFRCLV